MKLLSKHVNVKLTAINKNFSNNLAKNNRNIINWYKNDEH